MIARLMFAVVAVVLAALLFGPVIGAAVFAVIVLALLVEIAGRRSPSR